MADYAARMLDDATYEAKCELELEIESEDPVSEDHARDLGGRRLRPAARRHIPWLGRRPPLAY
jgi:hypothetical protein